MMIADGTAGRHRPRPRLHQVDSLGQSTGKGLSKSGSKLILAFLFVVAPLSCLVLNETAFLMSFSRSLTNANANVHTNANTNTNTNVNTDKISLIRKGSKTGEINRIVLIGERHSGTSYTTEMLRKCFPTLEVDDFFLRYKHWFQPTPEFIVNVTKQEILNPEGVVKAVNDGRVIERWPKIAALDDPKSAFENTILITMFRNPYDWMEAMRGGPHHWPSHFRSISPRNPESKHALVEFFPWKRFVAANMTLAHDDVTVGPKLCQYGYLLGTVSPCRMSRETYPPEIRKDYQTDLSQMPDVLPYSASHPIYELHADGTPFNHPLELRAAKIRDFLDIPNHWNLGGFMTLQHEDINMKGSESLLEQVSKIAGVKPSCEPDPPKRQESKQLDSDWMDWISEHADWKSEGLVGYERRSRSRSGGDLKLEGKGGEEEKQVSAPKETEERAAPLPSTEGESSQEEKQVSAAKETEEEAGPLPSSEGKSSEEEKQVSAAKENEEEAGPVPSLEGKSSEEEKQVSAPKPNHNEEEAGPVPSLEGKSSEEEKQVSAPKPNHNEEEAGPVPSFEGKSSEEEKQVSAPKPNQNDEEAGPIPSSDAQGVSASEPAIDRIVLIGERHSGTSYTTEMLRKCFPTLEVDDFFLRYKHWFQPTPEFIVNVTKQEILNPEGVVKAVNDGRVIERWPKIAALDDPKSAFENTILITMFRNPYDWMEAMRGGPHHWPSHFRSISPRNPESKHALVEFFPWKRFVAANMTLAHDDATVGPKLCQYGYLLGTVSPCRMSRETYPPEIRKDYQTDLSQMPDILPYSASHPIYELHADGTPFNHPLELRAAKIRDFLDIPNHWNLGGFMTLQHEDINMKGSESLLEQVSKIAGVKPSCEPDPPKRQKSKQLDPEWTAWISEHADWKAEASIGYSKRESR